MEIYVFRHGDAESSSSQGDAGRKLTDDGKEKTAVVAKLAARSGVKPSLILSSPYTRAVETARIAARELRYENEIVTAGELVPDSNPESVWNVIRERRNEDSILLAGHEPLLSHVVAYLLGSPALQVEMKKSALVRIDVDGFGAAPRGVLRWMIVPKLAQ